MPINEESTVMELLDHHQVELLSAVVFTLAFGLHLARAAMQWSLQIGPHEVPMYVSYMVIVVVGFLTYDFWRKVLNEYEVV